MPSNCTTVFKKPITVLVLWVYWSDLVYQVLSVKRRNLISPVHLWLWQELCGVMYGMVNRTKSMNRSIAAYGSCDPRSCETLICKEEYVCSGQTTFCIWTLDNKVKQSALYLSQKANSKSTNGIIYIIFEERKLWSIQVPVRAMQNRLQDLSPEWLVNQEMF